MAFTIPSSPPEKITAGATVKFTVNLPDFLPADSWVLTAMLIKADAQHSFTATNNGDGTHLVTITAVESAALAVATYRLRFAVSKDGERYMLDGLNGLPLWDQDLEVLADPATAGGADVRTLAQKMVETLEGILATHEAGAGHMAAYSMPDGRSMSFASSSDVLAKLTYWKRQRRLEVERENRLRGRGPTGAIKVNLR